MSSAYFRLEQLPKWEKSSFSPIEVPRKLLSLLGDPQNSYPCVHVAGTNGKGSVCTLISSGLIAQGSKVGQFASPHLNHIAQRCIINGAPACDAFEEALEETMEKIELLDSLPSYFVATMAASFLAFTRQNVDFGVIEVGLGGKDDATNLLRNKVAAVITSIGLDHTHILGDTLEEILEAKLGILSADVPAFVCQLPSGLTKSAESKARDVGSELLLLGRDFSRLELVYRDADCSISLTLTDPPEGPQAVLAEHQLDNRALACAVLRRLGVSAKTIQRGFRSAFWPGRLEEIVTDENVSVLLDGMHNPQSARALGNFLQMKFSGKVLDEKKPAKPSAEAPERILVVLAIKQTKDVEEIIRELEEQFVSLGFQPAYYLCGDELPSLCKAEELSQTLAEVGVPAEQLRPFESCGAALDAALACAGEEDYVVICGSLYLIGELRPRLVSGFECYRA